jgi:hypothetical protein
MFAIRRENDMMELFPYSTVLKATDAVFMILDSYKAADRIAECSVFPEIDIAEVKRIDEELRKEGSNSLGLKRTVSSFASPELRSTLDDDKMTPRSLIRKKATALLNVQPT